MAKKTYRLMIAVIVTGVLLSHATASFAEEALEKTKFISRGEMAVMLAATDFMKEKINALMNFAIGYNLSSLNRSTMAPIIRYIRVSPYKLASDGRTLFKLATAVDDPGGLTQIIGVRADISSLGRLSNMSLVDTGQWGDSKASDGVYTVQTSPSPKINEGQKEISVSVANKQGWLSIAKADVYVEKSEMILEAKTSPPRLSAGGKGLISVKVKSQPGPLQILKVSADLSQLGGNPDAPLIYTGIEQASNILIFTLDLAVAPNISPGIKKISVFAFNISGGYSRSDIQTEVVR